MIKIFETKDYGRIECDYDCNGNGTAYFFKDDVEAVIEGHEFYGFRLSVQFRIIPSSPVLRNPGKPSLEVFRPVTIAYGEDK